MSELRMYGRAQIDPVVPKKPIEETPVEKPQEAEFDIVDAPEPEAADPAVSPDGDIANRRGNKWETRKRTIEIELDGITISLEAETYDYDYPEKIQQETGILGYERTRISNESMFNFYRQYYKERHGFSFEEHGITDQAEMEKFIAPLIEDANKIAKSDWQITICEKKMTETTIKSKKREYEKLIKNEKEKKSEPLTRIDLAFKDSSLRDENRYKINIPHIKKSSLLALSGGEYPDHCYTHVLGAYGYEQEHQNEMLKNTWEDRIFTQKIYDLERIKKNGNLMIKEDNPRHSRFYLYNKKTGEKSSDGLLLNEMLQEPYLTMIKNDEVYVEGAIFTYASRFWGYNYDNFSVGFPVEMEQFQREYLLKVMENDSWGKYLAEDMLNFAEDFLSGGEEYKEGNLVVGGLSEAQYPIIINHSEIPQLAWGHAKYAHYSNDKSFNFFKFRHADHLPVPASAKAVE
ncbi:MAG: hypothetical protein WCL23_01080 [Candidatus Moraniibacteriota bacterium]